MFRSKSWQIWFHILLLIKCDKDDYLKKKNNTEIELIQLIDWLSRVKPFAVSVISKHIQGIQGVMF